MSIAHKHFYVATLQVVAVLSGLMPAAWSGEAKGWVLKQSSQMPGNQVAFICPKGMKVESLNYMTIVCPPNFSTFLYNKRSKIYAETTYAQLQAEFSNRKHGQNDVRAGATGTVAGLKSRQYFVDKTQHGRKWTRAEFWTTGEIKVPEQLTEYWCRLCEIPAGYGVPLRVIRLHKDKRKGTTMLDTVSAQRAPISSSTFKCLTGYKQVADKMSVMMGETGLEEDLLLK